MFSSAVSGALVSGLSFGGLRCPLRRCAASSSALSIGPLFASDAARLRSDVAAAVWPQTATVKRLMTLGERMSRIFKVWFRVEFVTLLQYEYTIYALKRVMWIDDTPTTSTTSRDTLPIAHRSCSASMRRRCQPMVKTHLKSLPRQGSVISDHLRWLKLRPRFQVAAIYLISARIAKQNFLEGTVTCAAFVPTSL